MTVNVKGQKAQTIEPTGPVIVKSLFVKRDCEGCIPGCQRKHDKYCPVYPKT